MRYLLLIPALTLFLSYIPFVKKVDMKQVMQKMGCCRKMKGEKSEGKCAMKDASVVCICGFQYAAPDEVSEKLQFGIDINSSELPGYLQHQWKDPQLAAPWQPPDVS